LREATSNNGKAWPIMAAQQRHPVLAVEAVVMCSNCLGHARWNGSHTSAFPVHRT